MAQRINAQQLVESQPGLFGYWSLLSAPNAADLIRPNVSLDGLPRARMPGTTPLFSGRPFAGLYVSKERDVGPQFVGRQRRRLHFGKEATSRPI